MFPPFRFSATGDDIGSQYPTFSGWQETRTSAQVSSVSMETALSLGAWGGFFHPGAREMQSYKQPSKNIGSLQMEGESECKGAASGHVVDYRNLPWCKNIDAVVSVQTPNPHTAPVQNRTWIF